MKTTSTRYLTKKEVIEVFKSEFKAFLLRYNTDIPAKCQAWNDYIDSLKKDNEINPKSDWMQPKFIRNK